MSRQYDAIVIGTGQAGPALAARLDAEGLRTAIIERGRVGGTCVNTGCTPTKTLVASARAAWMAREAERFGVDIGGAIEVDMAAVKARKDEIAGASNRGVTRWMEGLERVDLVRGHARFSGERRVEVDGETFTAERIFINVGGRARVPDWPGLAEVPFLTNSGMMDVDFLPEHLVIVGGSYIGLEFAQMYRRFGSAVTVIDKQDRIIGRDDDDVADAVRDMLEGEGVRFRLRADCFAVRRHGDGVAVRVDCDEDDSDVTGSHLLLAVGRVPNTDDLGLDAAGVAVDEAGYIEVDERLHSSAPGVWALGDVNGRGAFTHTSYNDYEIVAANLFDDDPRRVSDRIPCYGLFVDPPLGRIGMTEREARESGRRVLIGTLPMREVSRAREFGETRGFIKILVDADSERILGAAILGLSGDEAVHCLLDTMYGDRPYTTIARAVHIHPTVSELIPTVLQDLSPLQ